MPNKLDRNNPVEVLSPGSLTLCMVFKAEKYRGGFKAEQLDRINPGCILSSGALTSCLDIIVEQ